MWVETFRAILGFARLVPSDCFDVCSFFGKEQSYEVVGGAQTTGTGKGDLVLRLKTLSFKLIMNHLEKTNENFQLRFCNISKTIQEQVFVSSSFSRKSNV